MAEIEILQKKSKRYDELRNTLGRTSAEQAELNSLADELQDVLGDEVSVVNSLTGEYNDLTAAMESYIDKKKQEIELTAYEERALEAQKRIIETERAINEASQKLGVLFDLTHGNGEIVDGAWELATENMAEEIQNEISNLEAIKGEYQSFIDTYFDKLSDSYEVEITPTVSGSPIADNERAKHLAARQEYEQYMADVEKQYEEYAEIFDQKRKDIRYQYDMGLISAAEYYSQLADLQGQYLKKDSEQWRDVNVELQNYYKSCSDEQKKFSEESRKTRTSAYNEEKAQLQFRLKTNQLTEKKYYTELAKIRDKYLDKNSSEWRNAYLEAYEYNKKLLQSNKDTLNELLSDASDTTLSALENITAARDGLTSKLVDFNKTFEKITETVPETVAVKGEFTITTAEHEIESYRMDADSIEDNIRVLEDYGAMLEALKERGADDSTMNDILAMDVDEGMQFGSKLLKMSDGAWNRYFDSMAKLRSTAEDISAKYYHSEVDSLKENFVDKLRNELDGLGSDMYRVGADVAAEFVSGWNEALGTKDLTLGDIMRAVSAGTLDTAPKAAQQLTAAGNAAAAAGNTAARSGNTVHVPVYIGTKKLADIMVDATNDKIIQTGKNVLLT